MSLVAMPSAALARQDEGFNEEQIAIIRSQVAPQGTTNEELALFLMYCQRTGLDPFARQIYLSERRSFDQATQKWTVTRKPETTIDGFRLTAERTGKYAGQLGPFWCGEDGEWKDVWLSREPPMAAKVGILRHDFKEPLWGIALYSEYVQKTKDGKPNSMWAKMPANQLAKCAESLGNRKAFPRELSGMYSREEMGQAEDVKQAVEETAQRRIAEETLRLSAARSSPSTPIGEAPEEGAGSAPGALPQEYEPANSVDGAAASHYTVASEDHPTRGGISFKALKGFKDIKKALFDYTGGNDTYYGVLKAYGYTKSDQIKDDAEGRKIYKELATTLQHQKLAKDLLDTLIEFRKVAGERPYLTVLKNYKCEKELDVLLLNGTSLDALLAELKAVSDSINASAVTEDEDIPNRLEFPDPWSVAEGEVIKVLGILYKPNETRSAWVKA